MSDAPREIPVSTEPAPARAPSASSWRPRLLLLVIGLAGSLLMGLALGHLGQDASSILSLIASGTVVCGTTVLLVRRHPLEHHVRELNRLAIEVRSSREPVERLARFECPAPLDALASTCHDLARDVREERGRINALEHEVRSRIANRTEALERMVGALRQQAAKDGLTGLFNRRALDAYLPEAIERVQKNGGGLCVLMIDVDHFKPLNDAFGHAAGDQMLKSVAQLIKSTLRENDLAFRNGGDEFVAVLEDCDSETARMMVDRLDSLGMSLGRTFRLNPPPALSIGLATLADVKEMSAPALLRRADEALYQVKAAHHAEALRTGRSRKSA